MGGCANDGVMPMAPHKAVIMPAIPAAKKRHGFRHDCQAANLAFSIPTGQSVVMIVPSSRCAYCTHKLPSRLRIRFSASARVIIEMLKTFFWQLLQKRALSSPVMASQSAWHGEAICKFSNGEV